MKSIIQEKDGTCFLCKILNADDSIKNVEEHHMIYCKKQRKLSEKYGLKCYLCPGHHRYGKNAVHVNKEISEILYKTAQIAFERRWGKELFFEVFGQNWLSEEERERMNHVHLMGRLTRDPEVRYSQGEEPMAIARWTLAVDRMQIRNRSDESQQADFINCVTFAKQAEMAEKYLHKGMKIAVSGRIQTGSYTNREGKRVFTTEVVVTEIDFCESRQSENGINTQSRQQDTDEDGFMHIPDGIDEEIPFR